MTLAAAAERCAGTFLSGPVGGVTGAVRVAASAGVEDIITFDMGGTSTDVALVQGLAPRMSHDNQIDAWPLKMPQLDIHTIGAGGGSIVWIQDPMEPLAWDRGAPARCRGPRATDAGGPNRRSPTRTCCSAACRSGGRSPAASSWMRRRRGAAFRRFARTGWRGQRPRRRAQRRDGPRDADAPCTSRWQRRSRGPRKRVASDRGGEDGWRGARGVGASRLRPARLHAARLRRRRAHARHAGGGGAGHLQGPRAPLPRAPLRAGPDARRSPPRHRGRVGWSGLGARRSMRCG